MSIYGICSNVNGFMAFSITAEELAAKMGGRFNPRFNAKPYLQDWTKPNGYFFSEEGYVKVPDITCWAIVCLVLNQKAYDVIGAVLVPYGEFLPVECKHIPYYIFNALHIVSDEAIDQSRSKQDIELGIFMGVKSLGFHENQVNDSLVFKTNFDKKVSLFVLVYLRSLLKKIICKG